MRVAMPMTSLCAALTAVRRALTSLLSVLALLVPVTGAAQAEIYRCELGNGVVEYNNTVAAGKEPNCRRVDLPQITTIPAPRGPTGTRPAAGAPAGASSGSAKSGSPADFPKVDAATQRSRDNDRRQIIEEELKREEARLAGLRKEYNNGEPERLGDERNYQKYLDRIQRLREEVARSETNVGVLRKELAAIKD